jgi:Fe-S cluster assembly iron-binding protein IscA
VLAITPDAAEAISGLLSARELPEGAGLRITSEAAEDESGATRIELRLSAAEQPEEDDQVVEGGSVFIESEAASFLDDKLLDADASGKEVTFSLRDQAEAE